VRNKAWQGFWRLADPKISITSVACMVVGGAVAATEGRIDWLWLAVTGLALFCMEVAKNAWGDVYDYDSGTDLAVAPADRTPFSGGKRVLVDGLLTRRQTWVMALGFGGAGIALGMLIVFVRAPEAIVVGVVGLALGWSYHGPPLRLAYRGLGELDVVVCYGPLISLATYVVQTRAFDWHVIGLSLPLGIFTAAFLVVNEFPDHDADVSADKRNLVVRLGRHAASRLLAATYVGGFAVVATLPFAGYSAWVLLGLAPVPLAAWVIVTVWRDPVTFYRQRPVQPSALLVFVLYALGVGVGALLGAT
jgi:1,4-dihydroxy-2-naphthoate octaprenyltransferase